MIDQVRRFNRAVTQSVGALDDEGKGTGVWVSHSSVRAVPTTRAPRITSTRIVSNPSPELQPVTSRVLPARERPASNGSRSWPKPRRCTTE